jgi:thiamine biosynthesis protein ThiS
MSEQSIGTAAAISAMVNGERRTIETGTTITSLVKQLGLDPSRLAIELNRRIVKSAAWGQTEIDDGAQIEIVQFVGGG